MVSYYYLFRNILIYVIKIQIIKFMFYSDENTMNFSIRKPKRINHEKQEDNDNYVIP